MSDQYEDSRKRPWLYEPWRGEVAFPDGTPESFNFLVHKDATPEEARQSALVAMDDHFDGSCRLTVIGPVEP